MEIVVGKTAGFCYGVKRAVDGSIQQAQNHENLYCLGDLVHNKQVIESLEKKGIEFVNDIEKIKNSKVIIRAHGESKEVYENAYKNNIEIIDYTCPNVLKIHDIAKEYKDKGFYIFLCGKKDHPENIGTISYCGKNYSVINSEEEFDLALEEFKKSNIEKLLLISQTTYSIEKFHKIEEKIKKELINNEEIVIKNTICRATELRQIETEKLSKEVEYMIIIGGKNSSNTMKLYEIAKRNCPKSICIETSDELSVDSLKNYEKIGVMAGASTPMESINNVVKKIQDKNEILL